MIQTYRYIYKEEKKVKEVFVVKLLGVVLNTLS